MAHPRPRQPSPRRRASCFCGRVHDLTLRSPRLILEPLVGAHAEALYPALADPALYTFLPKDPPASLAELRVRFERLESRTSPDGTQRWLNWAARPVGDGVEEVEERATALQGADAPPTLARARYVGLFEATVYPDRTACIAYFVLATAQRSGHGACGAGMVLSYLFAQGVDSVLAYIDTRNTASIRLVEKVGLRRVRLIENADHFRGSASNEYVYRRDREDGGGGDRRPD